MFKQTDAYLHLTQVEGLRKENSALTTNISSLYKTAKLEIERKNAEITQLRNRWGTKDSFHPHLHMSRRPFSKTDYAENAASLLQGQPATFDLVITHRLLPLGTGTACERGYRIQSLCARPHLLCLRNTEVGEPAFIGGMSTQPNGKAGGGVRL